MAIKTVLEQIVPDENSSFRLMVNPDLRDFFFWHFHPEFELVFIDGADGTRHVGDHLSRYKGSDLVFIGSNIPHLNFDYGIDTSYEKYVVHIEPSFLQEAIGRTPELAGVKSLFLQASHGIAFNQTAQARVGDRVRKLHQLSHFEQFISMLQILQELSDPSHYSLLHDRPFENQYTKRDQERLRRIYAFVDENYHRHIGLDEISSYCNLSREAFCRYFKSMTRLTFTSFVNHYRIDIAKKLLLRDNNVTEACFGSGFESISYFNRTFKKITGRNPSAFIKSVNK